MDHIWKRSIDLAQDKLTEKRLPLLDATINSGVDISSTVGDLEKTINQRKDPGVGRLRKILKTIHSYAGMVDIAIQHNPMITALVWSGLRAILQVH